jgi:predicted ATPase
VQILCYDFEKDNPRVSGSFSDNIPMDWQVQARWMSHGQVVNAIHENLSGLARKKERYAIVMDEPDTGLSPRSAHELVRHMEKLAKRHQILAAVHNPILIASQMEVLSLEHRRWMYSAEFLEEMKKPRLEVADGQ